jgi:hypothetical protein
MKNINEQIHEKLKNTVCPQCNAPLDGATGITKPTSIPKAGDLTICGYCLSALKFNSDLSLQILPFDEIKKIIQDDPETAVALLNAQHIAKEFLTDKQQKQN